jgi:hypothetical protein
LAWQASAGESSRNKRSANFYQRKAGPIDPAFSMCTEPELNPLPAIMNFPALQAAGNITIWIPKGFAFGINSINASNFASLVFSECH